MSKKRNALGYHAKTKPQDEKKSFLFWTIMVFVVFFLFKTPFDTALFNGYTIQFEGPIYSAVFISSLLLIMMSIYLFIKWNLNDYRDLLSMVIWFVPLSFILSLFVAASPHNAKNMVYIYTMNVTFLLIGAYLARDVFGAKLIQLAITLTGYVVVLYGFMNLLGNTYFRDAVMMTNQGFRLTAVFQYANAYVGFLLAILLCCLFYISNSKKWSTTLGHALMLVPIVTSFWLTLSRGGIVVLPFITLAVLPLFALSRQITWLIYLFIGMAASIPIINKMTNLGIDIFNRISPSIKQDGSATTLKFTDAQSLNGWGTLLVAAIVATAVIILIQHFVYPRLHTKLAKVQEKKVSRFFLPMAIVIIGLIGALLVFGNTGMEKILPTTIQERVDKINFQQHSVLERGTLYKDSIKLFKDYPLLGTGGGGWAVLYEKYQNNPYTARQAHNFFLQYLIEVGLIGFIPFLLIIGTIFLLFFRKSFSSNLTEHYIFYFVAISLFVHSILDFDMSFVFIGALVFLCLGGMASVLTDTPRFLKTITIPARTRYFYPSFVAVVALAFFIMSLINLNSNKQYNEAVRIANRQSTLQEVLEPLDQAIRLQPDNLNYLVTKMSFLRSAYTQSKNEKLYEDLRKVAVEAKQIEPNNRPLLEENYSLYILKNQYDDALQLMNEAIKDRPWEISFYERALSLNAELWKQARAKNLSAADKYWNGTFETYHMVEAKAKEIEKLPKGQEQGRPFNITSSMNFQVGQMVFMKGDVPKATEYLQQAAAAANLDEQVDAAEMERRRLYIRWYLASLIKQNKTDQPLYDKLIANNAKEKQEIDALVRASF